MANTRQESRTLVGVLGDNRNNITPARKPLSPKAKHPSIMGRDIDLRFPAYAVDEPPMPQNIALVHRNPQIEGWNKNHIIIADQKSVRRGQAHIVRSRRWSLAGRCPMAATIRAKPSVARVAVCRVDGRGHQQQRRRCSHAARTSEPNPARSGHRQRHS